MKKNTNQFAFSVLPLFYSASDCKVNNSDYNYRGTVNVTKSSLPCKPWKDAPTKYQHLPENYCRAPDFDKDTKGVPWCYTVIGTPNYEICNIPICGMYMNIFQLV